MKILSAQQIKKADQFTIENEPISSIDLMERASSKFTEWFISSYPLRRTTHVFCGIGNNGGDGLAIARMLTAEGWDVKIYVVNSEGTQSPDFKISYLKLNQVRDVVSIKSAADLDFAISEDEIIVDAIFGTGLTRKASGIHAEVIEKINASKAEVVSVDIPSGLFSDQTSEGCAAVKANHVVTFQFPKLAFLLPENGEYVQEFHVKNIGLSQDFIKAENTKNFTIDKTDVDKLFGRRSKHSYKNQYGHALIIAGSYGKMGAAVLASRSCLKSGVGLLTVHVPECGYNIMQSAIPEAMVSTDSSQRFIHGLPDISAYNVVGIGPGLNKDTYTTDVLFQLFKNFEHPVVLDADAINIISENRHLIEMIPENSILTPHPGEFKRLVGEWKDDFERLEIQRSWSEEHKLIIVLKGAYTSVSLPDGNIHFNTTGNPGMATGGSGDVLTGIITGMLAQGLTPANSAIAGVHIHGIAGDLAKVFSNEISMSAGDIIAFLPDAFSHVLS